LRGAGERPVLPSGDVEQATRGASVGILRPAVEDPDAAIGIHDLSGGAPALAGALLEQTQRVAVSEVEIAHGGLDHRGGEGDRDAPVGHAEFAADADDVPGVTALRGVEVREALRGGGG